MSAANSTESLTNPTGPRDRVHAVVLAYECGLVRPGAGWAAAVSRGPPARSLSVHTPHQEDTMTSTTRSDRATVPAPRPVPDAERIERPEAEPPDWAAAYPLLRYAADHLRVLGERVVEH